MSSAKQIKIIINSLINENDEINVKQRKGIASTIKVIENAYV